MIDGDEYDLSRLQVDDIALSILKWPSPIPGISVLISRSVMRLLWHVTTLLRHDEKQFRRRR